MPVIGNVSVRFHGNATGLLGSVGQIIGVLNTLNRAFNVANTTTGTFGQAVAAVGNTAVNVAKNIQNVASSVSSTSQSVKSSGSVIQSFTSHLTGVTSATNQFSGKMSSAQNLASLFGQVVNNAGSLLQKFGSSITGIATGLGSYITNMIKGTQSTAGMGTQAQLTGKQLRQMEQDMMKAKQMAVLMGGAVISAIATAVKAGADFEHQFNQVAKLLDPAQVAPLKNEFLALSMTVPVSTAKLSEFGQEAARLGESSAKGVADLIKLQSTMYAVMGDSAKDVFVQAKRLTSVFGEGNDKIDETVRTLSGAADALATNEQEIVALASRVGVMGQAYKLSKVEIAAWAGVMRAGNVAAQAGGTALNDLIKVIDLGVQKGGKELQTLAEITGLTRKEFVELAASNPSEVLRKFFEGAKALSQGQGGITTLNEKLEILELDSANVSRVIIQTAGSTVELSKALAGAAKGYNDVNLLTDKAKTANQGLQAQSQILGNALKGVATILTKELNESLNKSVKWFADLARTMNQFDESTKSTIGSIVKLVAEIATIAGGLYLAIQAVKLFILALQGIWAATGWIGVIVTGLILIYQHFDKVSAVASGLMTKLGMVTKEAQGAKQAIAEMQTARDKGAVEDTVLDQIKQLKEQRKKLETDLGGENLISRLLHIKQVDKQLADIKNTYKDSMAIQVAVRGIDTVDNLTNKLKELEKERADIDEKKKSAWLYTDFANREGKLDKEIKQTKELIQDRMKLDKLGQKAPQPATTGGIAEAVEPVATVKAPEVKAKTTAGVVVPPTESQKIYADLEKKLANVEKIFKATGNEEDRLREKSQLLKKAMEDIAEVSDDTAAGLLTKVGAMAKSNEAAIKANELTQKSVKLEKDFQTSVSALTREKQLLGVTTETIEKELALYEARLKSLLSTEGASQQEIANTTAKIKELQKTLADSKAADKHKEILNTLSAAYQEASVNAGTLDDKIEAVKKRINALSTAIKALEKVGGAPVATLDKLKQDMLDQEAELDKLQLDKKIEAVMEKIRASEAQTTLEFEAFMDTGDLLKSRVNDAVNSLRMMYQTFGEGHPQVVQARDDLIAAKEALDVYTQGQTKYAAAMTVADQAGKRLNKIWQSIAETIKNASEQIGEALGGLIVGMENTKDAWKQQLKELLKAIISFVIKAIVQFIILRIVSGGAGGAGQSIGGSISQSIGAGLTGNISMTPDTTNYKAQGGVLTRPTVTKLAERGPEAVVPLTNGSIPVQINSMEQEAPENPVEITIINVKDRAEADRLSRDKKVIINTIAEDMEARGPIYKTVKNISRAR